MGGLDDDIEALIGREDLLSHVVAELGDHRLVTLTGAGGAGKTRIARAVVDRVRQGREALFVDLSAVSSVEGMAPAVATALGLSDAAEPELAVAAWATRGSRLLALDNLEQIPRAAMFVEALLVAGPGLFVLTTSRTPIGARGERSVPVPPLDLPADASPESVMASGAGRLFIERARSVGRLRRRLDEETAAQVAELCRRLDGLPLAIELAAARTRIMSLGEMLEHLDAKDVAVLRRSDGDTRHRSLDAVLDWTLGLLSEDERRVLTACAACIGTFGIPLVAAIVPEVDVLPTLDSLVSHGLVVVEDEVDREGRFRLLETVRVVVIARSATDVEGLAHRHAYAVAALMDRWAPEVDAPQPQKALVRIDADRANLEAALDWAVDRDTALAIRVLWSTAGYWVIRCVSREPRSWLNAALPRLEPGSVEMAYALATYTAIVDQSNDEAAWRAVAEDALALATRHDLVDLQLMALKQLTLIGGQSGDREGRLAAIHQMLALEPTTIRGRYLADIARFDLALETGGIAGGRDHLRGEVARLRPSGASRLLLRWLSDLGFLELLLGDVSLAVASAEEGVAMARDLGELDRECFCLAVLARARAAAGDLDAASTALASAVALALALGTPLERMEVLRARGSIAAAQGQPLDAAWFLGAAERAFDPTPVVDPTDDLSSGAGRHWRAARRAADPVAWTRARRAGYNAAPDEAIDRALIPLTLDLRPAYTPRPRLRHGVLTPRELEIMTLVGEGRSDIQIAERLYISPKTASVHVANVKAKLGVSNRVEVAIQAREMGIVA